MGVVIGCDPHKWQVTAAVLDDDRHMLAHAVFPTTRAGFREVLRFVKRWDERRWAVEGARGAGASLAQRLTAEGEVVVDVPAKLAARVRLLSVGHGRKNDVADAVSVAIAALEHRNLTEVGGEDHATVLRLLSDRRDDLVRQRTQTVNRLHALLGVLVPGHRLQRATADQAAQLLRRIRPRDPAAQARRRIAVDLVEDIRRLDRRIKDLDAHIQDAVKASQTTLVELFGVGPVLAAKILGHTGRVDRFVSKDHYASYTGTAPVEASSGGVVRHRLSRAGNRQLNHALYIMALCQIRRAGPGQAYFRRKLAEGKSQKEAIRCLKRRLSDAIYRTLMTDHQQAQLSAS